MWNGLGVVRQATGGHHRRRLVGVFAVRAANGAVMSNDPQCIFCKIATGDVPAHRVLETETAVAFLDVGPVARGHVLLIPRSHWTTVDRMPADVLADVTSCIPRLAAALMKFDGVDGINVLQNNGRCAGQVVEHVHFHLIPRRAGDGLGYRWNAGTYGEGEAETVRDELAGILGG